MARRIRLHHWNTRQGKSPRFPEGFVRTLSVCGLIAAAAAAVGPAHRAGAATPLLAGLRLIDGQGPAAQLLAVDRGDRLGAASGHLDEAEAARAARLAVHRHL